MPLFGINGERPTDGDGRQCRLRVSQGIGILYLSGEGETMPWLAQLPLDPEGTCLHVLVS